jgi:hypothetical protein
VAVLDPQMSDEARRAVSILNRLADELRRRQDETQRRLDYYEGRHKLCYASPEFGQYFSDRFAGFSDNWCAPVISGPAERMNILGVRLDADSRDTDKDLARVWRSNDGPRGSSELFVIALSAGRAYSMVWGNPRDEDTPRITWERPDQAVIAYDSDTGERAAGLKLWADDTIEYATLYLPDRVWKFSRPRYVRSGYSVTGLIVPHDTTVRDPGAGGWEPRQGDRDDVWPLPNPMGEVPLVEWRNQTLLDDRPLSDISGVAAMQDSINLTWAYLLNALDFASMPQRIVLGADMPTVPVLDENGQKVGERVLDLNALTSERILWIPGENVNVAQWAAANLDVFRGVIETGVEHVAAQTRTPPHYLIGRMVNMAAEALTAAETGLVAKTEERIVYFDPAARETFRMVALAQGDDGKAKAVRDGLVVWKDTQFRALAQKVDALAKARAMGFPFKWIAEQYGLEPYEVERVLAMREAEAESDPMNLMLNGKSQPPAIEPAPPGEDPMAE